MITRRPWILAVLTSAALGGCVVGPNFRAPKPAVPTHWATPMSGGETAGSARLATWWRGFNDPMLDALIQSAVRSNYSLRIAEDRVREARAERDYVAGGEWPSVGTSAAYSDNRYGAHAFPPLPATIPLNHNLYDAGFDASWELDVFGRTRRAVEAATAQVDAAEYHRSDVVITLLAEVARDYIAARGAQQRLEFANRDIEAERAILALTRSRYESGLSSELDVEQATAALAATQAQVPTLEGDFDASVHELGVLLGRPPGALLGEMTATRPIPVIPPVVPVGLPSDLLKRRPDVREAEREIAAATARIGVAKTDYFPSFSLTGAAGLTSTSSANWLDFSSRFFSIGPTINWKLFEGGRIRANVRLQTVREEEAVHSYDQTVLGALEDVENTLDAYARKQSQCASLGRLVRADRKALYLSKQLYTGGLVGFLPVLDSERSLYAEQDTLIQCREGVSSDLVRLYKALGGGWRNPS
ncbi:MAG TPA: efflux transporter outer membrane subunit [Steroidobacteraceae bacterium]|nr:efflux transporter outer membrane subunit [Steroidobacteraceae bacterium]